jgi:hypothetical protein
MREVNKNYQNESYSSQNGEETVIFNEFMEEVLSLVPEALADSYRTLPRKAFEQDERTLRTILNPSEQQQMLRTKLWQILNERLGISGAPRISISEICRGVSNTDYLERICTLPYVVAWLLCPTLNYETRVEALVEKSYDRMSEILDLPIKDNTGAVDMKVANLVLQVAKMIDMRSRGGYVERIEQKTLNVNASAKEAQAMFGGKEILSLDQIEERIKMLETGKKNE